jgi:hypothetical protein
VPGLAGPMAQTEHEMELSAVANAGTWASMKVRLCVCDHACAILYPSAFAQQYDCVWEVVCVRACACIFVCSLVGGW